jgi:hypothetical protein
VFDWLRLGCCRDGGKRVSKGLSVLNLTEFRFEFGSRGKGEGRQGSREQGVRGREQIKNVFIDLVN